MQLLRFGTIGLLLLASFAAPSARADQPLDEPAPFGVIQFSPDEAWIDLPYSLGDSWSAALAVLKELKYDVKLDAAYVETNGQLRVADLWVAVEPHGSREKMFTRIRIALDKTQDEYTQVRAEVILDAVATRLAPPAPPAPAPAPAAQPQSAEQPVDPGVQDVYTGAPIAAGAYAYSTPGTTIYNTYNTYNYASYPTPYYANYGYYAPFCSYFPYWSCWNQSAFGWNGGHWCSPFFNSWACGPTFTFWNTCPSWGLSFGFGSNSWWNFGFSGCWGNFCNSIGCPWNSWGNGGGSLVVVTVPDPKPGKGVIGLNPKASGMHTKETAKAVAKGKPVLGTAGSGIPVGGAASDQTAGRGGLVAEASGNGSTPVDLGDGRQVGSPAGRHGTGDSVDHRGGSIPRIQVTHRERNESGTRFDPRTTVTRTIDTHTIDSRNTSGTGTETSRGTPGIVVRSGGSSSLPRVTESDTLSHGRVQPGKVVRMSSPSFRPGFAGVTPGAARPVSTVDGNTATGGAPYGVTHGSTGNPYAGLPAPAIDRAPSPSAPAPVFNAPGTASTSYPMAPRPSAPSPEPSSRSSGPVFAPPPVTAPRPSAPMPSMPAPVSRPPAVSIPTPSMGGGGGMSGPSGHSGGGGPSGDAGGGSGRGGNGHGRP
jgi:hypothetical protein